MPRSFVGNMVNKNFAIEPLPRVVYVHSQSSYKSNLSLYQAFWDVYSGARIPRELYSVGCWELSGKFRLEIPSYINDVEGDV